MKIVVSNVEAIIERKTATTWEPIARFTLPVDYETEQVDLTQVEELYAEIAASRPSPKTALRMTLEDGQVFYDRLVYKSGTPIFRHVTDPEKIDALNDHKTPINPFHHQESTMPNAIASDVAVIRYGQIEPEEVGHIDIPLAEGGEIDRPALTSALTEAFEPRAGDIVVLNSETLGEWKLVYKGEEHGWARKLERPVLKSAEAVAAANAAIINTRTGGHQADGNYNDDGAKAKLAAWESQFITSAECLFTVLTDAQGNALFNQHGQKRRVLGPASTVWTEFCFIRFRPDGVQDMPVTRTTDGTHRPLYPRAFAAEDVRHSQLGETRFAWPLTLPDGTSVGVITDEWAWEDSTTGRSGKSWKAEYARIYPSHEAMVDDFRDLGRIVGSQQRSNFRVPKTRDEVTAQAAAMVREITGKEPEVEAELPAQLPDDAGF